ncbi:SDR family NAD(P)-dependent oxidoreductase [Pseudonocardia sp. MH-G8]|uniref:SDR family NAD(P)-dependent oxidoreductase n=1 Tax=Pseudonocardia sp. MH-G8 TaxID=1854588 RepID=UPI000BA0EB1F|nr:SDR family oxidoreductase [Pseudonocardia sp. MH-G8]OZM77920.1 2-deoxy-D-gluconate 3-dehydrogenase [Pseudonocardia sp. MH-G8]
MADARRGDVFDLDGAVAVVTGAARGIGFAASRAMARRGAVVVMFDLLAAELEDAATAIRADGSEVVAVAGSVTDEADLDRLVEEATDRGPVSVVANCAGVIRRTPIDELTLADLQVMWDVNVGGTVGVTQRFLPTMIEQRYGKVINVGSLGSVTGLERRTAYATTKGAVSQYTVSLASEVGVHGIRANVVAPGYVDTAMTGPYIWGEPARTEELLGRIPLGRFAKPEDLEGLFVFLASPASDYITGQVLVIDGGWRAR